MNKTVVFIQQLSYSTAYSLDESLIPTGFIQQLFYSTAYSLDESLIPTGFIQLFIPMAALIWSHFLFNNWFHSTTVLFNCLFTVPYSNWFYSTFYSDGRPYLVALFIQQLVLFNNCFIQLLIQLFIPMAALIWSHFLFIYFEWPPLFGHPYFILITTDLLLFFFLWKKRCLTWIRTRDLLISSLDAYRYTTTTPTTATFLFIYLYSNFFVVVFFGKKRCLTWDSNPGPLDLQSGCLPLHHHHHTLKAIIKLITTPLHSNYQTDHHTPPQQLSN